MSALAGAAGALVLPTRAIDGGGRTLEGWGVAVLGLALGVLLAGRGTPWRRAAALAALFLLGTAARLALTKPVWLQYVFLQPAELLVGVRPVALAILVAQTVVVAALLRGRVAPLRAAVAPLATAPRLVGAAILFLMSAAHFSLVYPHLPEAPYLLFYVARPTDELGESL